MSYLGNAPPVDEMTDQHRRFLERVDASADTVWDIARRLQKRGFPVTVNPTPHAPTHAQALDYSDSGDLYVGRRVEVKHLSADFTCREDWPFGKHFIVCSRHSFDRAVPKPWRYLIVNRAGTHVAVVEGDDHPHWEVHVRADGKTGGRRQEFYFSPIERVRFFPLERL